MHFELSAADVISLELRPQIDWLLQLHERCRRSYPLHLAWVGAGLQNNSLDSW